MDVISMTALANAQAATARNAPSGRAAHTVHGGSGHALRQVIMALAARHKLAEHENPGEATLLVLSGLVELATSTARATLAAGEYVVFPQERHELTAIEDSVVLLTVVSRAG
ncbi:cupin domain-containing protein [Mycobacteroides abscessus]|nr:cupin domain-containing protein [Mycobacteroides abscessus]EUA63983.1 cupin domain protein [Mycobacteroides abscessus 1948]ALM15071.1 cupin [Mycobacteroides abscessus]AMU44016.1 cupin [Mycobacteroides abscessus]AMU48917.1 cupin [Mycobacteroides abscessus]ANO07589.1 cupin [Mycobacteroides abscessus]